MRGLNYHHLRYFWTVAREGHLTRAAAALHVSQSALSAQIRQLEDQLGHALFTREGRSLQLTEVGRVVLDYADGIFSLGSDLLAALGGGVTPIEQRIRIGATATLSRNFQTNFLRPVIDQPNIRLTLRAGSLDELLAALAIHDLDLVLSNRQVIADGPIPWRCRRIARRAVALIGQPLPPGKTFRYPDDIARLRLLLPGRSSDIRAQFDLLCERLGLRLTPQAEVDDMTMLRLLARDSEGVALVPPVVVQDELRAGRLAIYCQLPEVQEHFYAITIPRRREPPMLAQLLKAAESEADIAAPPTAKPRPRRPRKPPAA